MHDLNSHQTDLQVPGCPRLHTTQSGPGPGAIPGEVPCAGTSA